MKKKVRNGINQAATEIKDFGKEKKDDDDDFKRRSTNFKASMCQKRLHLFLVILCGSFKAKFPQIGVPKD